MIEFSTKGDWSKTSSFLERSLEIFNLGILDKYGKKGVEALKKATPKDTGKTASSWYYQIVRSKGSVCIQWLNSNIVDGVPVAILIQYGHALQNGAFVKGEDFINPAILPVFNDIADEAWKELTR